MKFFKHFVTITRHRHMVMRNCFKCGLIKQGLLHDLSKYSLVEFKNGVKYFVGTRSPNDLERMDKGFSEAWMHHKGRNKHHSEYWVDVNPLTKRYEPVIMPFKYVAEMFCDRIAASKNYNRKTYQNHFPLDYFNFEQERIIMHEKTKEEIRSLLTMLKNEGEDKVFKYIKSRLKQERKK